jgi:hypothetical protein
MNNVSTADFGNVTISISRICTADFRKKVGPKINKVEDMLWIMFFKKVKISLDKVGKCYYNTRCELRLVRESKSEHEFAKP